MSTTWRHVRRSAARLVVLVLVVAAGNRASVAHAQEFSDDELQHLANAWAEMERWGIGDDYDSAWIAITVGQNYGIREAFEASRREAREVSGIVSSIRGGGMTCNEKEEKLMALERVRSAVGGLALLYGSASWWARTASGMARLAGPLGLGSVVLGSISFALAEYYEQLQVSPCWT